MKFILLTVFSCFSLCCWAQETDATASAADSSLITIHADPRLDLVVKKNDITEPIIRRPYKTKGYRIQIYNGSDRSKATQAKVKFMKLFPGLRSYLVYQAPNYRVRVGDYRSRGEAQDIYEKLSPHFSPRMIVPDMITVTPKKTTNDK